MLYLHQIIQIFFKPNRVQALSGHFQLAWPSLTPWLASTQTHQRVLTWLEQQCVLVNSGPTSIQAHIFWRNISTPITWIKKNIRTAKELH